MFKEESVKLPPLPAKMLGISGITVEKVTLTTAREFVIKVKSSKKEIKCKKCHKVTDAHGYGRPLRLRHLSIFDHPTYIEYAPARGVCRNCDDHPTTTEESDWYNRGSGYTKAYERYILMMLVNSTITDVSIKEDIGYKAIEGIVDRYIATEVNWSEISELGLIGIDEISLKKGYQDYVTLITSKNGDGVKILGILKGREKAMVKEFLSSIPKKLQKTIVGVCTDMYDGYINAAKEVLGADIAVIADRYHVSKLYRKSLVGLRKKELKRLRKELGKETYQKLKPAIALLCRRKEYELSKEEKRILTPLFESSPKLKKAYNLCLKLTAIYNTEQTAEEAKASMDNWIEEVESSDITCFADFIKTLKKYQTEICNYFMNRHSSGFVEGFNNKVKVLKRRCYGIFNIKHLFQRISLDFSGYQFLTNAEVNM